MYKMYLHNTVYTTAKVIKAMHDRPQPTISVIDGTPGYSITCELDKNSSDFECLIQNIRFFYISATGSIVIVQVCDSV